MAVKESAETGATPRRLQENHAPFDRDRGQDFCGLDRQEVPHMLWRNFLEVVIRTRMPAMPVLIEVISYLRIVSGRGIRGGGACLHMHVYIYICSYLYMQMCFDLNVYA